MANKLPIWDVRMLDLMAFLIFSKVIEMEKDFFIKVGFPYQNGSQLKTGKQSFRHEHILKAAKLWKIDLNWIYGITSRMMMEPKNIGPIDLITDALLMLEQERKQKGKVIKQASRKTA